jgi:hypothetical protein
VAGSWERVGENERMAGSGVWGGEEERMWEIVVVECVRVEEKKVRKCI